MKPASKKLRIVLVTGNMKDIRPLGDFRGTRILTPREFLDAYFPAGR